MAPRRLRIWYAGLFFMGCVFGCDPGSGSPGGGLVETQRVQIGTERFKLELVLDPESRFKGLSDRASIPDDGGMLFVFPYPRQSYFVMRRCLVPIDLIFLGSNGRIASMHRMRVEPYDTPESQLTRYGSEWDMQFAIELKSGTIDRLGLELGQRIDLPVDDLKRESR